MYRVQRSLHTLLLQASSSYPVADADAAAVGDIAAVTHQHHTHHTHIHNNSTNLHCCCYYYIDCYYRYSPKVGYKRSNTRPVVPMPLLLYNLCFRMHHKALILVSEGETLHDMQRQQRLRQLKNQVTQRYYCTSRH